VSQQDYDLIDHESGAVVVSVRHLWPHDPEICCMCERRFYCTKAVPYYCGPTIEPHNEGGWKVACDSCYARWDRWSAGLIEYRSWERAAQGAQEGS